MAENIGDFAPRISRRCWGAVVVTDGVTLLGVKGGPAIRTGSPSPTASLLRLGGEAVVIDCGLGVTRALVEDGFALKDLATIVVTHLHSDHVLEFGPLLHTAWTAGLNTPVRIIGPRGLPGVWSGFLTSMEFDVELRIDDEGRPELRDFARFEILNDGFETQIGPLRLTALRNDHPPIEDSFALRVDGPSASVVFSGDTAFHPPLIDFARGADLLVHEAMLSAGVDALCARVSNGDERLKEHLLRSHSTAEQVAEIATAAGVGALALHHLIPADDPAFNEADWIAAVRPHWSGRLHVGRDGMRIPFGPAVEQN